MRTPEQQSLELLPRPIERGDPREDRTGVGTFSVFRGLARFDLSDGRAPTSDGTGRDQIEARIPSPLN